MGKCVICGKSLGLFSLKNKCDDCKIAEQKTDLERRKAQLWLEKGFELGNLDSLTRHQDALAAFEKALSFDPKCVMAWEYKGISLSNLERYQETVDAFDKLLIIDPTLTNGWYYKGFALDKLGRYQEAVDAYDKTLSIDPTYANAWCNKGTALYNLGRYQDSLDACEKALSINPNDELAWNNKGGALANLGRYQEAVIAFDKALLINPNYAKALKNKGDALDKLGRYQDASKAYESFIEAPKICKKCHGGLRNWFINVYDPKDTQKTKEPFKICIGTICTQCDHIIPDFGMILQVFKAFDKMEDIQSLSPLIDMLVSNGYTIPKEIDCILHRV